MRFMQRNTQRWLALALAGVTVLGTACGEDPVVEVDPVADCLAALGDGDVKSKEIEDLCGEDVDLSKAQVMLVEIRLLVEEINALLDGIDSLPISPAYAPAAGLPGHDVVESFLKDLVAQLEDVEAAYVDLQSEPYENVAIDVAEFKAKLNLSGLKAVLDEDYGSVELDASGEWTRVPFAAFGGLSSGVLGLLEFVLAHDLTIELDAIGDAIDTDNAPLSSSSIATLLAIQPKELLSIRSGKSLDTARGELEVLSSIMGGTPGAGAGLEGLLTMLDEQIAEDDDQSNNVVAITDVDGDGKFGLNDSFDISILESVSTQLVEKGIIDEGFSSTVENAHISRETLEDAQSLVSDLHANLKGSSTTAIDLNEYLVNAKADLDAYLKAEGYSTVIPDPKSWLGVNPKKFFDANDGLREYLPLTYAIGVTQDSAKDFWVETTAGTVPLVDSEGESFDPVAKPGTKEKDGDKDLVVKWDFVIECELAHSAMDWADPDEAGVDVDSLWRYLCGVGSDDPDFADDVTLMTNKYVSFDVTDATVDVAHFVGQTKGAPAYAVSAETTPGFVFIAGQDHDDISIDADEVTPVGTGEEELDGIPYFGLNAPSFGGAVVVDPAGAGNFKDADNGSLNHTVAEILNVYYTPIAELLK